MATKEQDVVMLINQPNNNIDITVDQPNNNLRLSVIQPSVDYEPSNINIKTNYGNNDHAKLKNLDYEHSGHTGFASSDWTTRQLNILYNTVTQETGARLNIFEQRINVEIDNTLQQFEHTQDIKIENKLNLFEQEINTNVENRLTIFQEEVDENIDNRINILGNELNTRIDIFEANADKKYVPQRLNAFGTMDISGQTIIPDKAYTYVDVKLPNNQYQSTRVDLADIIQTKIVTEDINPDLTMRSYDYIFTKLVNEGE